jgi:uncharacterized membrane protein
MKGFNFRLLGAYLLRGTFILAPVFFTFYAIWMILEKIDSPVQEIFFAVFGFRIYGLGLLTIIVILIVIGYLGSTILMNRVFKFFERMIFRIPLVKEIYKTIRDVIGAFASDKKKFEKPVLVETMPGISRIGFVTNDTLQEFGIDPSIIAVYFPLSYAFTGELLLVKKELIKPLSPSDVGGLMKFIISGGIVNREEKEA